MGNEQEYVKASIIFFGQKNHTGRKIICKQTLFVQHCTECAVIVRTTQSSHTFSIVWYL